MVVAPVAERLIPRGAGMTLVLGAISVLWPEALPGRLHGGDGARAATPPAGSRMETYEKRRELAEQTVKWLRENRYEEATERFDPALKQALPPDTLKALWEAVTQSAGPFERSRAHFYERFGAAWLLRVDCRWQKCDLVLRFAFDREQRICGLWVDAGERRVPEGFPKGGYRFGAVIEAAVRADLSLEVKIVGLDGRPIQKGSVAFWMAVDPSADEEGDRWHDPATGKTWCRVGDPSSWYTRKLKNLAPGVYRAAAWSGQGRESPLGLSDPIALDGKQKHTVVTVRLAAGSTLTLRAVDAATGKPAPPLDVSVACKSGHLPPQWRFFPKNRGPVMKIEHLPPATYAVSARLWASRPDALDYTLEKGPLAVEIVAGQDKEVTLPMRAARLSEEQITRRWPWSVVGRVTDGKGNPVEGVTVRAHCGMGTLRQTGITETGKDGRYTLRFSPGAFMFPGKPGEMPVNLQAATISVSKPGFVEKNLHRQGDLTMANRPPPSDHPKRGSAGGPVLPGRPVTVDFVLVPALAMDGELLDAEGKPIAAEPLWIGGKELPPSSSVLRSGRTDGQGRFRFEDVPPGYAWWFSLRRGGPGRVIRSLPLTFPQAQPYHVRLRLRRDVPSGLNFLEVLSVANAKGEDVSSQVVGDDPLMRPPLPPEFQAKGRAILAKVFEANRYWLDRPPPEVRTYRYDFRLGSGDATTYEVPENGAVPGAVRQGVSYVSVLHGLKAHPERVVFRQVDVLPDKIALAYTLTEAPPASAGNGVLGPWRGFFSRGVPRGTLVIDPKTYALREHRSRFHQETLSDYVEIRPGHVAPLRVRVSDGGMEFDFRFRVYEPGLWLFASSGTESRAGESGPVARIDKVTVNGQPGKVIHQRP